MAGLRLAPNRSLRLAQRQGADQPIILDADTRIEARLDAVDRLVVDAYMLGHLDGDTDHATERLVRPGLDWRYVGVVHEYIESAAEATCESLAGVIIRATSVGALRGGRFERDRALLEASPTTPAPLLLRPDLSRPE